MTKFIASVARRFAECVDFLDEMNEENRAAARSHSSELRAHMKHSAAQLAHQLERDSVPFAVAKKRAQIQHAAARLERNMTRSQQRRMKLLRQQAILAE